MFIINEPSNESEDLLCILSKKGGDGEKSFCKLKKRITGYIAKFIN